VLARLMERYEVEVDEASIRGLSLDAGSPPAGP
jgi:hypothetical protein